MPWTWARPSWPWAGLLASEPLPRVGSPWGWGGVGGMGRGSEAVLSSSSSLRPRGLAEEREARRSGGDETLGSLLAQESQPSVTVRLLPSHQGTRPSAPGTANLGGLPACGGAGAGVAVQLGGAGAALVLLLLLLQARAAGDACRAEGQEAPTVAQARLHSSWPQALSHPQHTHTHTRTRWCTRELGRVTPCRPGCRPPAWPPGPPLGRRLPPWQGRRCTECHLWPRAQAGTGHALSSGKAQLLTQPGAQARQVLSRACLAWLCVPTWKAMPGIQLPPGHGPDARPQSGCTAGLPSATPSPAGPLLPLGLLALLP